MITCTDLDVFYGQAQVLFGVDLHIAENEMVALLGINGAGKSTLLKAMCGLLKPARGVVRLRGEDITGLPAERIATKGMSMVPGGRGIFPTLTVAENLRVAGWMSKKDKKSLSTATDKVLAMFPVLGDRHGQVAGNLSGGEQQMLTLAQSFITRPDVLIIDELSLGLAPIIVGQLLKVVRAIHDQGVTVVLVEQSLNVALDLCERAVFMEKGEVRFDGSSTELRDRPDLLRSVFLGSAESGQHGHIDGPGDRGMPRAGNDRPSERWIGQPESENDVRVAPDRQTERPRALEVGEVTVRFGGIRALSDVCFRVHDHEIVAIIGGNGAGKTTLFDVISGFLVPDTGSVLMGGKNVVRWSAPRRGRHGLGRSFQDSLLFPSLTVRETIAVALDRHTEVRDPVSLGMGFPAARDSEEDVREAAAKLVSLLGLGDYADAFLSELSTGTRRMVDIACSLGHEPDVLLLDEPAAGIAQKETEKLGPMIRRIRDEMGCSIVIIEHDMPLIRAVADRVYALEAGSVIAEGSASHVMEDPRVVASYLGTNTTAIERSGPAGAMETSTGEESE